MSDARAALLVLGELSPAETEAVRREFPDAVRRMEATVAALRAWAGAHQAQRRARVWPWPAAAAVLLAVGGAVLATRPDRPPDLAWTQVDERAFEARAAATLLQERPTVGVGAPPGPGPEKEEVFPALEAFARQFPFPVRAPARVLDGFVLERGRALGPDRAWLLYRRGTEPLSVFVSASEGRDFAPRAIDSPRRLVARRKAGVLIAFDPIVPQNQWEAFAARFQEEKP
jgi:hypothetical protein